MGVDFYPCKNCNEVFSDCGDYVYCECDTKWCSDECAEDDGYVTGSCRLGKSVDKEGYTEEECESAQKVSWSTRISNCNGCINHIPTGCKYCRNEDYSDEMLLDKALGILNMTREELVNKINEVK